ncbi:MAG: hypothetical protein M3304_09355 [Actinomycetota bacterium]|nr:hypothetical protein [Actinomycetota bacterium]
MIPSSTGIQPSEPQRGQPGFVFTVPPTFGFAYVLAHDRHWTVTRTVRLSMS